MGQTGRHQNDDSAASKIVSEQKVLGKSDKMSGCLLV